MSFSLFSKALREKTQGDHCAIAVVKAHESYDKASFANCWRLMSALSLAAGRCITWSEWIVTRSRCEHYLAFVKDLWRGRCT